MIQAWFRKKLHSTADNAFVLQSLKLYVDKCFAANSSSIYWSYLSKERSKDGIFKAKLLIWGQEHQI